MFRNKKRDQDDSVTVRPARPAVAADTQALPVARPRDGVAPDAASAPAPVPVPGPAPDLPQAYAADRAEAGAPAAGRPSREPIVLGTPTLRFEPKRVAAKYRRVPYRPDTVLDGWATAEFCVRGASVRGYLHRYDGSPRQDDFVIAERGNGRQIIAAVADGVSEAAQSHIGSTTAVRYASQWLDSSLGQPAEATDWYAMIENTAWALVEQARAIDPACTDAAGAEQMLSTTLVCAVVEASEDGGCVAHVVSVGDSGAWCLAQDGYTPVAGGKGDAAGGISSSAVAGLPRVPPEVHATRVVVPAGGVLLLGTDGFGDPLGSGTGLVGGLFAEILRPGPPSLTEFGHALDFSRDTFDDDRTLVAIWPRAAADRDGRAAARDS
jgi:hypothetical protein